MDWQKQMVIDIKKETNCTHEQAMLILGKMYEVANQIYTQGYDNGYTDGINKSRKIKFNQKIRVSFKS